MKELDYTPNNSQLTLTDRVAIEVGLARNESFAKISKQLRKHPHTIAREVKENRTHLPAEYAYGNDCKNYAGCRRTGLCGADPEACDYPCKKNRYYYNAKYAEAAVTRRRSISRSGVRFSKVSVKGI